MAILKTNPTLADLQKYIAEMEVERNFAHQTAHDKCLLLGEEIGELFKAVRKQENFPTDNNSKLRNVDEELADVLIFLLSIANRYDVNLEEAFRKKETINEKRTWK